MVATKFPVTDTGPVRNIVADLFTELPPILELRFVSGLLVLYCPKSTAYFSLSVAKERAYGRSTGERAGKAWHHLHRRWWST